ncbi:hypothetical protein N7454_010425 [Penicillium verhagenii]|nr:hypothetical protein N7454_010425 [Penicillium verhagenii]
MRTRFLDLAIDSQKRNDKLKQEIMSGSLKTEFTSLSRHFAAAWVEIRKRALPNPRAAAIAQHWLVRFQIPGMPVPNTLSSSCIANPMDFVRVCRNTPWTSLIAPHIEHIEDDDDTDKKLHIFSDGLSYRVAAQRTPRCV